MTRRDAGWVGWEGVHEEYQLVSNTAGPRTLKLGVASGSRCPRLGHLHAGSIWNGAVRLAQVLAYLDHRGDFLTGLLNESLELVLRCI